jgi:hypothetical protein
LTNINWILFWLKNITISGVVLCNTSAAELNEIDSELAEIPVEEMDICKDRFVQDSKIYQLERVFI